MRPWGLPGGLQSTSAQPAGREVNLQHKEQKLPGGDKGSAPCVQEVHQVALTEEEKPVRAKVGDAAPGIHPTAPKWSLCPQRCAVLGALTLLRNSMTM